MALLLVHQRALLLVHVVADLGGDVFALICDHILALFRVVDFGVNLLGHRVTLLRVFGRAFLLLNCLAFFLGHGIADLNISLRALPATIGLALLDVFGGALLVVLGRTLLLVLGRTLLVVNHRTLLVVYSRTFLLVHCSAFLDVDGSTILLISGIVDGDGDVVADHLGQGVAL